MCEKPLTNSTTIKNTDVPVRDYELTCRLIEMNMPIVPPLKLKVTLQYPQEPPEILSLTSTSHSLTAAKLENSDGHTFFETISRNFVYFLFKLPSQHTITDILDIWVSKIDKLLEKRTFSVSFRFLFQRTAIRNASLSENESSMAS